MADYNFRKIESKWQDYWEVNEVYKVIDDISKPKYYILDMFPYPSAAGLHIGHPEGYTATDIVARYKRMKGYNVLHPMGFDAFGLPTERYCMQTGIHPSKATQDNISNYIRQLSAIGFGYDWTRMVNTTKPQYYKWTQWMFSLIYNSWYDRQHRKARHISELPIPSDLTSTKEIEDYRDSKRLAFIANIPVNWCEGLGTVLANEEVEEWKNKGYKVERKPMRQWMLRITEYADRLLEDLDLVDWPNSTKEMQKNWIGKSIGAEIVFDVMSDGGNSHSVKVFTTRPDTVFGATYMVLAPEHPLVQKITTGAQKAEVAQYVATASTKSDLERTELNKSKTGVWTGAFAVNPASGGSIPVWIADYVLAHYGTGAIMAVPAHDERDYEFARQFSLDIKQVVTNKEHNVSVDAEAFCDKTGIAINSANSELSLDGLETTEAIPLAIKWLEQKHIGSGKVQFKLRDWLFSRQRYWGEPMPIIYYPDGTKRCMELPELPLMLPQDVTDFQPAATGESPLANIPEWVNFFDTKTGKQGSLETNTMPQWAGSCWYYLRYIDPNNDAFFVDKEKEAYWLAGGVDLYIGGAEHAVLHLLYARFWHKVLFDYGHVSYPEPFKKLFHQGLIIGEDGRKMSKSLGNVINPDEVIKEFGADALRLFEMFLGPLEAAKPWSKTGIEGVFRFLNRVWRLIATEDGTLNPSVKDCELTAEQAFVLNFTIKKIADDIENLSFNTAVSQMMIFVNEFNKSDLKPRVAMEAFVVCLSAFAPHIGEELWHILGHKDSVVMQPYPTYDESKLSRKEVEFVVQVGSKIRGKISLPLNAEQNIVEETAKKDDNVAKFLANQTVKKVVFVKNKLINFII